MNSKSVRYNNHTGKHFTAKSLTNQEKDFHSHGSVGTDLAIAVGCWSLPNSVNAE
jgi:hypothetical protein